jgi:imidazole glycerol phosphate synthase subunit HisF
MIERCMKKCTNVGRVSTGTEALTDPIGVRRTANEYGALMVVIFVGSSVGFADATGLSLEI